MDQKVLVEHVETLRKIGTKFPTVAVNLTGFLSALTASADQLSKGASFGFIVRMVEDLTEQVTNLQRLVASLNEIIDAHEAILTENNLPLPDIKKIMGVEIKDESDDNEQETRQ